MAPSTKARRQQVLNAIVADYIASQEPVGSKALVERHRLQVSSATIRNDMAALESEGLIAQQHASSGRIPTEKGYRMFVDSIHDIKPLSSPERKAILSFLEGGVDLEDVLRRSVQLLAQLTRQAAVIQLPSLQTSKVKHCEVVALSPTRLLLVMITDLGRVEQRNVELMRPIEDVSTLRALLNTALADKTMADASVALADLVEHTPGELKDEMLRCATVLIETLVEAPSDRLILAGTSNLSRISPLSTSVLEALEEQVVVLKLLSHVQEGEVNVSIGAEHQDHGLHSASIVSTGYGDEDATFGALGVVGPTYMDYTGTISKVSAVAQYVSRVLKS
ncbi:Heat-inducible transcription repressor HrcA [Corynebacterium kalinowskii]|uniref:Heat-inducible transcription repressor HrcA n=1 Tax=Corynebacterium kalinowskii TaxID=2675216 RepID=A0A6B8VRF2_9CORY|nr:heat-inducible transcriptional repressor HrcA [Corynebacterium kalinowskii]QGU01595.1 Heat-inducible transcription repressor HrcA [Corynebacterium kalinowskii]